MPRAKAASRRRVRRRAAAGEIPQDALDDLISLTSALSVALGRVQSTHVAARSIRNASRKTIQAYFRECRPYLSSLDVDTNKLSSMDDEMQLLLRLSGGSNRKSTYLGLLRRVRNMQRELSAEREIHLAQRSVKIDAEQLNFGALDLRIADTLARLEPSSGRSYQQAVRDLAVGDRMSYRGTASELREVLRETLDRLAPDEEVMKTQGFSLEQGQSKPTQKQKVRYILRSRGIPENSAKVPEDAVSLVEGLTGSLMRSTYTRGSIAVHTAADREEVLRIKAYVDLILCELLEVRLSDLRKTV